MIETWSQLSARIDSLAREINRETPPDHKALELTVGEVRALAQAARRNDE